VHLLQAPQLLVGLLPGFLRHARLFDAQPVFLDFLGAFIQFAQLFVNGPDLFAQKVIPLALGDLVFDIRLDFGLHHRQLHLTGKQIMDFLQARHRIDQLDHLLSLVNF
jgi:hypothetical protein